jgi:hypothetical protein
MAERVDSSVKISPELAEQIRNDIKSIMAKKGFNLNTLAIAYADKYGRKMTVQNLGNKINKGTIRFFEVLEIADVLGYEVDFKLK